VKVTLGSEAAGWRLDGHLPEGQPRLLPGRRFDVCAL